MGRASGGGPSPIRAATTAAGYSVTVANDYLCLDAGTARAVLDAQPPDEVIKAASRRLAVLGEPNRLRIALILREVGELCVGDTATLLGMPIALVSHHVRSLAAQGLAEQRKDGKLVRYRLTDEAETLLSAALRPAVSAD